MPEQSCVLCHTTYDVPYGFYAAVESTRDVFPPAKLAAWLTKRGERPDFSHGPPTLLHACERTKNGRRVTCPLPLLDISEKPVDWSRCPECGSKGRYDGRVLVAGRGVYHCDACSYRWQDPLEQRQDRIDA